MLVSNFRLPRFGRHSGSKARRARSSSVGTPSRILSVMPSSTGGKSVEYDVTFPKQCWKNASI